ncbi:MAG: MscL family protein [Candidatus Rokubacteria bacterium]|nr:MscL family protein [Candidatus Rokubacteria bacterium]
MWKGFREFAVRGDVVDLAVAVRIGGAFRKTGAPFVSDILMPSIVTSSISIARRSSGERGKGISAYCAVEPDGERAR